MLAKYGQLATKTQQELKTILNGHQFNRLAQIMFYVRGNRAVLTGKLQTKLGITDEQKEVISEIIEATNTAIGKRRQGEEFVNVDGLLSALSDEDNKVSAVLTDKQRASLRRMAGEPFDRGTLTNIRFRAPEFGDGDWIQTGEPLEVKSFHGQVLVVHFWVYG